MWLYEMTNSGQNTKKLTGNDKTENKYVEAGKGWDFENASKEA